MLKKLILLSLLIFLHSCNQKKNENALELNVVIKGLKKGTVYIQKIKDTSLVVIDTITINGNSNFTSQLYINEPEMHYLFLDRGVTNSLDNNIPFFAEKGKITITTSLDYFTSDAVITGSRNHQLYQDFKKIKSRYTNTDLDLIEKKMNAFKNNKINEITVIDEQQKSNMQSKYLFATNFAVNNANYDIAPYIALTEISDINLKYLDTIQVSLSKKVSNSLYGKKLKQLITQRRNLEK